MNAADSPGERAPRRSAAAPDSASLDAVLLNAVPVGNNGHAEVTATLAGRTIHADRLDLTRAKPRAAFAKAVAAVAPAAADAVEPELLRLRDDLAAAREGSDGRGPGCSERTDRSPTGPTTPTDDGPADGRPTVKVEPDEFRTNDAAAAALESLPDLYCRGSVLVRVEHDDAGTEPEASAADGIDRPAGAARIVAVKLPTVRDYLTRSAVFVSPGGNHVHPPAWCVAAVAERGEWPGLRPLVGVAGGPVLRPDGTVLASPGYDAGARLLVPAAALAGVPPIPEAPTRDDAARAAGELLDVVTDFPFAEPHHRSAWLAATLTLLGRPAFSGPAPLFLFDANTPGSGKGLLADVTARIGLGRPASVMPPGGSDEEVRKRITSLALSADPLVLIDNVAGSLGCPSLDSALTATAWTDRIMGGNRIVTLPMRAVWFATGNNVALAGDLPRRVIHVRLQTSHDRPENRDDFRHDDLPGFVSDARGRLAAAGLTILRAYFAAGRPAPPGGRGRLGSFAGWCGLIRDAIVWCGLPDPLATRAVLMADADRTGQTLAAVLDAIVGLDEPGGVTARDMLNRLSDEPRRHAALLDAVRELCDWPDGSLPGAVLLGNRLRTMKERVCGGRALTTRQGRGGTAVWSVRRVGPPRPAGGGGGAGGAADGPTAESEEPPYDGPDPLDLFPPAAGNA